MNPSNPDNPYGLQRPPAPGPAPAFLPPPPIPSYAMPVAQPAPARALPIDPRSKTAAIILFVCAGLLLLSCGTYSWFTGRGGRELGVIGIQRCHGASCESMNWMDFKQAPSELRMFAIVGLLGAAAAIGFLIHSGVVLVKGAAERVKLRGVSMCLAAATFGMVSFVIELVLGPGGEMSIGWGSFVGIGSVIAASAILTTWVRPMARARAAQTAQLPMAIPLV